MGVGSDCQWCQMPSWGWGDQSRNWTGQLKNNLIMLIEVEARLQEIEE